MAFIDPSNPQLNFGQALLARSQQPFQGIGGGLQSAGNAILGALLTRRGLGRQEEQQQEFANQLANLISPQRTPAQTQMALAAGGGPTRAAAAALPRQDPLAEFLRANPGIAGRVAPNVLAQALQPRERQFQNVPNVGLVEISPGQDPRVAIPAGEPASRRPLSPEAFQQQLALRRAGRQEISINTARSGVQFPDPPRDFVYRRNPDGSVRVNEQGLPELVAIPGSETAQKRQSAQQAQADRATQQRRFADVVTQDIDRVLGILDEAAITGPFSLTQAVPGTPANDAARLIDTIRANVGFDRLQALRDASPTGGALGQVSEQENRLLQSTLGNLELSQSETQFRTNLQRLKRVYLDIIHGPGNRPRLPQPVVVTEGQQAAGQVPQRPEGPTDLSLENLTPEGLTGLTDEQLRSLLQ